MTVISPRVDGILLFNSFRSDERFDNYEKKVICTMYHISESRHVSSLKRKIVLLFKIKVHLYSVMHPIPRPLDKTALRMSTI